MSLNPQFWSTFILLIINEYSISRDHREDTSGYISTLCEAEIDNIQPSKLDNYITCCKIVINTLEYIKSIFNIKVRQEETLILIT